MGKWEIKSAADYAAAMRGIQAKMDSITEGLERTTVQAVADVALDGIGRSVERAPVETGDLRGSGYASVNGAEIARGTDDGSITVSGSPGQAQGNIIEAEIGYDSQTDDYAFVQHEHVEFNHPLGGQAKYLESVVVENVAKWKKQLADAAREALGGDGK